MAGRADVVLTLFLCLTAVMAEIAAENQEASGGRREAEAEA